MGATLPTPLYVIYQRRFHFSEIELTLLYSVYICGSIGGLLFFGRLSDQVGRRRVLWPALAVAAASTAVFLFRRHEALLFIARVLSGLAVAVTLATVTAFLAELEPAGDKRRATGATLLANLLGLGLGPLLAGLLAQYERWPTRLVFYVYLGLLALAALALLLAPETLPRIAESVSLRPRAGVPKEERRAFISPSTTAFCIFALLGLFTALAPSMLSRQLRQPSHALAGAVVFELYAAGALAVLCLRRVSSRRAMMLAAGVLFVNLALLLVAMKLRLLTLFLIATAVGGVAVGLGFRGSLEIVNLLAPDDRRSEVLSVYYLVTYFGIAVPAIGVGVLTQLVNPFVANVTFTAAVAVLGIVALITGIKYPAREMEPSAT